MLSNKIRYLLPKHHNSPIFEIFKVSNGANSPIFTHAKPINYRDFYIFPPLNYHCYYFFRRNLKIHYFDSITKTNTHCISKVKCCDNWWKRIGKCGNKILKFYYFNYQDNHKLVRIRSWMCIQVFSVIFKYLFSNIT